MLSQLHPPPHDLPRFDPVPDLQAVPRSLFDIHCLVEPLSRPSSGTVEDDSGPVSPSGPNYHYAPRSSRSPDDFYGSYGYTSDLRRAPAPSPGPIDAPQPLSAPHAQERFSISAYSDRQPRYGLLPKISTSNILDQRRLSEPAVSYMPQPDRAQQYSFANYEDQSPHSPESPFLSRVASLGSLRHDYSPSLPWKEQVDEHRLDFAPAFSAGISDSPPVQYALRGEDNTYGPSPPGTSTSSSSTAPATLPAPQQSGQDSPPSADPSNKKTYSFVALPGNAVRKRPRRRYDEIERLYHCSWPDCNKAYGTLNHLNAHVQMQKHGAKRSPNEFKELRKQWRKAKKEYESPGLGPIRRSMSLRRDDLYHGHPYGGGHHRSFSHNSALAPPLSVSIPHLRQDASYGVDHLRYPPDSRGEIDPQGYGGLDFRQQSAPTTAWPASSSRTDIYQSPLSAQPSYPYLDSHSQMMESPPAADPYQSPARSTMNRLPPDSMLLTPLVTSGQVADSYADNYYDDSKARSGHPSNLDRGSGDEY
ncbi:hypothetical protein C8R47DRAFT_1001333 [Mycena vitilis]|nr:hypothetical protein C8R47DRAFT_1001333 [Mycena vitilis]